MFIEDYKFSCSANSIDIVYYVPPYAHASCNRSRKMQRHTAKTVQTHTQAHRHTQHTLGAHTLEYITRFMESFIFDVFCIYFFFTLSSFVSIQFFFFRFFHLLKCPI